MKSIHIIAAIAAIAAFGTLSGCGGASNGHDTASASASDPASERAVRQATGTIAAVAPDSITIDHGPVASLKWPAMTMSFAVPAGLDVAGLKPGDPVAFSFGQAEGGYELKAIVPKANP